MYKKNDQGTLPKRKITITHQDCISNNWDIASILWIYSDSIGSPKLQKDSYRKRKNNSVVRKEETSHTKSSATLVKQVENYPLGCANTNGLQERMFYSISYPSVKAKMGKSSL